MNLSASTDTLKYVPIQGLHVFRFLRLFASLTFLRTLPGESYGFGWMIKSAKCSNEATLMYLGVIVMLPEDGGVLPLKFRLAATVKCKAFWDSEMCRRKVVCV